LADAGVDRVTSSAASLRKGEIIAVGSELLGDLRVDTNSLFLAGRLAELGIELRTKAVVGDSRHDVAMLLQQAIGRADLIILTGGLGPTEDDVTRDAVADVLGLPLDEDPGILTLIRQRFERRGLQMPEVNRRQALVPRGAQVLENPNGTAPGLLIEHRDRLIVLLPGPPRELQPIFEALVSSVLAQRTTGERLVRSMLIVTGRTESHVEQAIQHLYGEWRKASTPVDATILASPGQIELHLSVRSDDAPSAERVLAAARQSVIDILGDDVVSTDGRPLEKVVGDLLHERALKIAVAESCTGGLLLSRLTDIPGSSAWVAAGAVAYSNESKTAFADVPPALIQAHGAVSEPVAVAMAEGIRARLGSNVGVGVTGIAGPSGGTPQKPVGTVAIAVVAPDASARVRSFAFPGGRAQVKYQATQAALDMVRRLFTAGR
jgi:nicotinamide-nucleotide amidase